MLICITSLAVLSACSSGTDSVSVAPNTDADIAQIQSADQTTLAMRQGPRSRSRQTPTETPTTKQAPASSSTTHTQGARSISRTVTYGVPRGSVSTTYNLSVDAAGTITSLSASTSGDRESVRYADRFESAAQSQIVGKKISSLSLRAVGGASLTTDAFVQAITNI